MWARPEMASAPTSVRVISVVGRIVLGEKLEFDERVGLVCELLAERGRDVVY